MTPGLPLLVPLCGGLVTMLVATVDLSAHGGRYRGAPPNDPNPHHERQRGTKPVQVKPPAAPKPPPIFRPGPAPSFHQPTGPLTPRGTPVLQPDASRWQLWWEMNKDRYLLVRPRVRRGAPVTGSDDYYLGSTRRSEAPVDLAPNRQQVVGQIMPALHRALLDSNHPDLVTACLIGLAKIGRDHGQFELLPLFAGYLRSGNQEIRETAALALGVSRRAAAMPLLRDLLTDSAAGRRLVGSAKVGDRVRAFAAYGLGIVLAHADGTVRTAGFEALHGVLTAVPAVGRDVRVAAISALGAMGRRPATDSADKRLRWRALRVLETIHAGSDQQAPAVVRAHAPVAIGRLLGRGEGVDRDRYRAMFAAVLESRDRPPAAVVQSAVLALGQLGTPDQPAVGDRLFRYFETGRDQQARYFCLIALGEIGGDRNRARLLKVLAGGKKALERPWAALALGVLTHRARRTDNGRIDETVGRALEQQLHQVRNRAAGGAFAVALGLSGYRGALPGIRKLLDENRQHDEFAGFLCTGLGLADDRPAIGSVRAVMHRSARRPHLLRQSATALGRLQDKHAAPHLLEMVAGRDKNTARMAAVAGALQFIGDRRTVDALIARLHDDDHTRLARAFIAAALGGIADPMELPFAARYAAGCNYRAVVATLTDEATGILDLL